MKQPPPRSAGNRRHLVRMSRGFHNDPGNDACVIIDVKLSAPDATAQRLDDVIKKPGPRG